MMNVGVPDRQVCGELCVSAEMPIAGWMLNALSVPPTIGVTTVTPDTTSCTKKDYGHGYQMGRSSETDTKHRQMI
jgi:hypothetical protein